MTKNDHVVDHLHLVRDIATRAVLEGAVVAVGVAAHAATRRAPARTVRRLTAMPSAA